jgi:hypothetical protein
MLDIVGMSRFVQRSKSRYSITPSACTRSNGGTSKPSAGHQPSRMDDSLKRDEIRLNRHRALAL